jgi:hypothetical protein
VLRDIGAGEPEAVVPRGRPPGVVEPGRQDVGRGHAEIESTRPALCDERARHVGGAARHLEHLDPLGRRATTG